MSDQELRKAYWLFRLVAPFNNRLLASWAVTIASFVVRMKLPIVRSPINILFEHFCGGENIEECKETVSMLAAAGIKTTLDYCVEALEKETDLDEVLSEIVKNIAEAKNDPRIPFCVFKITSVVRGTLLEKVSAGETLSGPEISEYARAEQRVDRICKAAFVSDVRVLIDAEESWMQNAIDDLAGKMMRIYNKQRVVIFDTFQMYRKDRMEFLRKSHEQARASGYFLGVKLVRGAYLERESARATRMRYPSHKELGLRALSLYGG